MKKYIGICVVALCIAAASVASGGDFLRCVVLDVGEGQAVLLQRDTSAILVDTGHFGQAAKLRRSLRQYGVERVEAVILTHLDADHASGIFAVMDEHPQALIYESGHRIPFKPFMEGYRWVAEKLDAGTWEVRTLRQNEEVDWRGVKIKVLWPERVEGDLLNPYSLVLEIVYGEGTCLIMGDVGTKVEETLLREKLLPENVDVLVVGHHGAADATSSELLQRLSPEYAVVSINADNKNGYPSPVVMQRLHKSGAIVHPVWQKNDFVYVMPKTKQ